MVIEGQGHKPQSTPAEVAEDTVRVLRAWPADLAGVAFLSGGNRPSVRPPTSRRCSSTGPHGH
ncbi:fructose-bisphosphate aldolase class-I family protein [Mycobacterium xenopi 4042]|uniref:fructose-bisphosphate aldolase n=1 Tax=Mycobacterium xenopi 4042 TaxID=1299334 RepID=X7ZWQ5_MYCXE|nr:fructose-bisphosphate aldolase class-I family protein [Mycobacterium xenopi 4042]